MLVSDVHLPIKLRVLAVSILKNIGIICSRALKAAGINDFPGEGRADKHKLEDKGNHSAR